MTHADRLAEAVPRMQRGEVTWRPTPYERKILRCYAKVSGDHSALIDLDQRSKDIIAEMKVVRDSKSTAMAYEIIFWWGHYDETEIRKIASRLRASLRRIKR